MANDAWIERFKQQVLPIVIREVQPEQCILFGSRISGKASEHSDIDLIVVSPWFRNIPFVNRMSIMLKKARFEKHIDYICYSPEEFERNRRSSMIIRDALTYGERLSVV